MSHKNIEKAIDTINLIFDNSDMKIIQIIRELRSTGLSQSEIAKGAGICQSSVSEICSGKRGHLRPSYRTVSGLEQLAKKHCPHVLAEVANNSIKKDKKQSK